MAAACLFLAAKVEEQPRKLEHVIKVSNICQSKETNIDTKSEVSILYMIDSDQDPDANRHSLMSLFQITVRFKGILKLASFTNSQIYGQFIG